MGDDLNIKFSEAVLIAPKKVYIRLEETAAGGALCRFMITFARTASNHSNWSSLSTNTTRATLVVPSAKARMWSKMRLRFSR
jgi:hypothetical protein